MTSTVPNGPAPAALLPARMINEHVYCPRLFYFEHVEGIFVHNAANQAMWTTSIPALLGLEGNAARLYFGAFAGMIKRRDGPAGDGPDKTAASFDFSGRNRRPPRDPVNALLSLAYALLSKDCSIAAWSAGFDPYVGFFHEPRFGRPALALDVMEEFRPIIADSVVLTLLNNRMMEPRDFVTTGESVGLTREGRKKLFVAYERRLHDPILHPVFGYRVSYRRALELQFRLLANVLTGEIEQYSVFECDLTSRERVDFETALGKLIKEDEDRVLVVHLGPSESRGETTITSLGQAYHKLDVPCYVV